MCPEAIDFEDEVELLTSSYDWEAEESLRGVWMRACPHCNAVLCKTSLGDDALRLRLGVAGVKVKSRLITSSCAPERHFTRGAIFGLFALLAPVVVCAYGGASDAEGLLLADRSRNRDPNRQSAGHDGRAQCESAAGTLNRECLYPNGLVHYQQPAA